MKPKFSLISVIIYFEIFFLLDLIDFSKLFQKDSHLPIKLELCSGNGDWVTSQVKTFNITIIYYYYYYYYCYFICICILY